MLHAIPASIPKWIFPFVATYAAWFSSGGHDKVRGKMTSNRTILILAIIGGLFGLTVLFLYSCQPTPTPLASTSTAILTADTPAILTDTPAVPTQTLTIPTETPVTPTDTLTLTPTPTATLIFYCEVRWKCDQNEKPIYFLVLIPTSGIPGYRCSPPGQLSVKPGDSVPAKILSGDDQTVWEKKLTVERVYCPQQKSSVDGDSNKTIGGASATVECIPAGKSDNCKKKKDEDKNKNK